MASKNLVSKEEEFKSEFKRRVKDEAKMLYRKTLDEVSDRHKFVCKALHDKGILYWFVIYYRRHMIKRMGEHFITFLWSSSWEEHWAI